MLLCLAATLVLMLVWYGKDIAELDLRLRERRQRGMPLGPLVQVPYRRSLIILMVLIAGIALHYPLEMLLGLRKNTILMAAPLTVAGVLMIWRHNRARHYVETSVEWWTLLFFMMLFAKAGTLEFTGITGLIAGKFNTVFAGVDWLLTPVVMLTAAIGSAFVDNVVFVAAFNPVIENLAGTGAPHPLWWALLFGACFGGNITMIGSTANIVALGMMEKRYRTRATFMEWLKVGLVTGLVSCLIAWLCLLVTGPIMLGMKKPASAKPPAPPPAHGAANPGPPSG
jgi:Na+/H+ antiporter NhaD/arsenite permease-like protein